MTVFGRVVWHAVRIQVLTPPPPRARVVARAHLSWADLTLPIVGEEGAGKGVAGSEIIQDCAHDDSQQMGVETITCDRDKPEPPAVDAARRPLLDDMKRRMFQVDEQWDDETKKRINMSETDIYDSLDMKKDALRANTPEWLLGREVRIYGHSYSEVLG